MAQQSKQRFLILLLGFSFFYEVQSSIILVYPFRAGHMNPLKPKFSSRKLDSDDPNVFNKTNLHIIYPINEELVIMTPTPMEKYYDTLLDGTTETSTSFGETDSEEFVTTFTTTTDIPTTAKPQDLRGLRSYLELTSMVPEDTTTFDVDTTTDIILVETETPKTTTTDSPSQLLPIYDSTGPLKFLRKRMHTFGKYSKKHVPNRYRYVQKASSTTKRPTTAFKTKYRRYRTTAVPGTTKEILLFSAIAKDEIKTDNIFDSNKERRRYGLKRRPTTSQEEGEEGSANVNINDTERSEEQE